MAEDIIIAVKIKTKIVGQANSPFE